MSVAPPVAPNQMSRKIVCRELNGSPLYHPCGPTIDVDAWLFMPAIFTSAAPVPVTVPFHAVRLLPVTDQSVYDCGATAESPPVLPVTVVGPPTVVPEPVPPGFRPADVDQPPVAPELIDRNNRLASTVNRVPLVPNPHHGGEPSERLGSSHLRMIADVADACDATTDSLLMLS